MSIPTRQEILFRNKTIILVLYFILACILPECNDFHRTIVKFPKIIQGVITKKGNNFSAIALLYRKEYIEKGAFLLERRLTEMTVYKDECYPLLLHEQWHLNKTLFRRFDETDVRQAEFGNDNEGKQR